MYPALAAAVQRSRTLGPRAPLSYERHFCFARGGGVPAPRESGSPARRALLNWCHLRPHGGRRTTSVRTLALHGGRQRSSGTEPDGTTLGIGQIVTRRGRYRGHEASCS